MPRNGSGTATLAEAPFVPGTVISSSAMNSDLSDIANMLTGSVASDGQTTITGPFKGASGSVGLPMYSFSADTDSGMYRIGANNLGIGVNATKILDIGVGGLTALYLVQPAGTVSLPSYTFSGDLDSGIYSIGANNIGVAVNAAKVLDISTTGLNVIGSVSSNGAPFSPTAQGAGMVNGTIVESHAGNAVTFAIKTLAGADPSATDIVYVNFRNATPGTGNYVTLQITSALSLVVSSGSTLGTLSSNIAFRLWLVLFNDAGTIRLGVINCTTASTAAAAIYPLRAWEIAGSTAEGGAGGADSAQVFYTGTAVSAKAYAVIGYASYETGVATAGSWAASPTRLQLVDMTTPMPGAVVRSAATFPSTATTTTSSTYQTTTNAVSITPTSAANLVRLTAVGTMALAGTNQRTQSQLFRDSTGIGPSILVGPFSGSAATNPTAVVNSCLGHTYLDAPNSGSAITYAVKILSSDNASSITYPTTSGGSIIAEEIMA